MENVRYNISPCTPSEVSAFIAKIDRSVFVPNGQVRATDKSHYDRYLFLAEDNRIALVFDTRANILSITGRSDFASALLSLFDTTGKSVKRSTVPAQGTQPTSKPDPRTPSEGYGMSRQVPNGVSVNGGRAKLFVPPEVIRRRSEFTPAPTVLVSSNGAEISTDEIYPPQTIRRTPRPPQPDEPTDEIYPPQVVRRPQPQQQPKRPLPSYGESRMDYHYVPTGRRQPQEQDDEPQTYHYVPASKLAQSQEQRTPSAPRRATISFGSEDDTTSEVPQKRKRGRPPKNPQQLTQPIQQQPPRNATPNQAQQQQTNQQAETVPQKRKRGRPPKNPQPQQQQQPAPKQSQPAPKQTQPQQSAKQAQQGEPEYKNGYSVKNFSPEALGEVTARLRALGKSVVEGAKEFVGTPKEVVNYIISDASGHKIVMRYATKRKTLQLQGKRSDLFGEVISQVSSFGDCSSALETYVDDEGDKKMAEVRARLKKLMPTAYDYLSEQSRIDFSFALYSFGQKELPVLDYSVLLVPAFRGLERFIFDLQTAEDIKVKMIGQAFDKDEFGRYILKSGYTRRIDSVIYPEVLVALYTEYFSRRNYFSHSDNSDSNTSRAITDRVSAKRILDSLLVTVEYNAKKLKEIGFTIR